MKVKGRNSLSNCVAGFIHRNQRDSDRNGRKTERNQETFFPTVKVVDQMNIFKGKKGRDINIIALSQKLGRSVQKIGTIKIYPLYNDFAFK
jgi:hypothetical protein